MVSIKLNSDRNEIRQSSPIFHIMNFLNDFRCCSLMDEYGT